MQLKVTNEQLESFTYSVSHDLRTPLRTISANAAMLKADFGNELPEEAQRLVERVVGGAERMGLLIDDLLALSRIGREMLKLERIDMAALAREAAGAYLREAPAGKLEVNDMPSPIADARLVRQLLENLISNAVKFTSKRPEPRIEVGFDADRRAYFVRDNGVGFETRHAQRLFEPFERLHPEEEFGGTGIGLAIVKRIAEAHGGRVFAESTPSVGSRFFFTLGD
jgi:signal transduction histidine kinase